MDGKDRLSGEGEHFLARWSRRKREARGLAGTPDGAPDPAQSRPAVPTEPARPALTDADMPPIDGLQYEDDWSGFLSPGVSEQLRGEALRRLFSRPELNVTDGLDSYSGDYTCFEALGDVVTSDMRHRAAQLSERARSAHAGDRPTEVSSMESAEDGAGTSVPDPRQTALAAMAAVPVRGTGIVNYAAAGRVLVVGQDERAIALARELPSSLTPTVVLLGASLRRPSDPAVVVVDPRDLSLTGHLGDFRAQLAGGEPAAFDQVVDLCRPPLLGEPWRRFGYHVPTDGGDTGTVVEALLDRVGEFEKPRYFQYDPSLCVRGRSGMIACNRCVQACPAGAITGLAERVEVDPFLCQGGGICATVCPGGAMQYAYPPLGDVVNRLRRLLEAYRAAGGENPRVLVHDTEATPALDALPTGVLPLPVEEVASVGIELWLSALAFGARAVWLEPSQRSTHGVSFALDIQLGDAAALLEGLGYPAGAVGWRGLDDSSLMPAIRPAAYGGMGSKREVLFLALDHLAAQAPAALPSAIELPATVPLGEVVVDPHRCTLCVACATVCPRGAISAEEGTPALVFFEARCVQCGLCERACPERAILMRARFLTDREARSRRRTLHTEPPFECVSCGKPFATRSSLERVLASLGRHPMFQDEAARRRLQMCADCRVVDLMRAGGPN